MAKDTCHHQKGLPHFQLVQPTSTAPQPCRFHLNYLLFGVCTPKILQNMFPQLLLNKFPRPNRRILRCLFLGIPNDVWCPVLFWQRPIYFKGNTWYPCKRHFDACTCKQKNMCDLRTEQIYLRTRIHYLMVVAANTPWLFRWVCMWDMINSPSVSLLSQVFPCRYVLLWHCGAGFGRRSWMLTHNQTV